MAESNPYEAPESELTTSVEKVGGDLDEALEGNYNFTVSEVFSTAWELSKGFKRTFWGAVAVLIAIYIGFALVSMPFEDNAFISGILQLVLNIITYPLFAGITMLAVFRAAGREVQAMQVTSFYPFTVKIILLNIVMILLTALGFLLLILPGIYLSVAYMFALPLMLDKKMGIWEALETSRKIITHKWFNFFGVVLLMMLMLMAAGVLLLIGLIWAAPVAALLTGVLYMKIAGVESE